MKQYMLCLAGLLLLGCGHTRAEAIVTAAPTAQVQIAAPTTMAAPAELDDEERILAHCRSILDELPCSVDMDGDGTNEIVDLVTYTGADEYPRWAIVLTAGGAQQRFETDVPFDMEHDLWVGDIDEDGAYELFFHGDLASDDYIIYAFRHDLSPLSFEPDERAVRWGGNAVSTVYDGYIEGFEDGHIVIEGVVDMLGTHWGVRNFALGDDGVIGPVSSVWEFAEEDDRFLTVTRELRAYAARVRKDPGEAFTLQPGEKVYPLASDGCERMWFRTEKGKTGVLLLTYDADGQWFIDGAPEAEYFEFLPYAG